MIHRLKTSIQLQIESAHEETFKETFRQENLSLPSEMNLRYTCTYIIS